MDSWSGGCQVHFLRPCKCRGLCLFNDFIQHLCIWFNVLEGSKITICSRRRRRIGLSAEKRQQTPTPNSWLSCRLQQDGCGTLFFHAMAYFCTLGTTQLTSSARVRNKCIEGRHTSRGLVRTRCYWICVRRGFSSSFDKTIHD